MPRTLSTSEHDVLLGMLRNARARQGVTQEALAVALGFRQSDISKAERGVRRLDDLELRQWVGALGLNFIELAQEVDQQLKGREARNSQIVRSVAPGRRKRGSPK